MRKFKYVGAVALLFLTACATSADTSVTWGEDGHVANSSGKQTRLEIQGIYDALNYAGFTYLAGFKIDKDGTNYPHIAKISNDLSAVNYWSFEKIPNDIFVYKLNIHSVSTDGEVYKLERGNWDLTNLRFPPDSQVVYSDNNSNAIVCYPAALAKAVTRQSGCKSLINQWQLDFVWHTQVPKMCDGKLYAVSQEKDSNIFKKIDITTGKEIFSSQLKQVPEDLCSL
jgi:hypothetical protein